jgi:hypothetical protein
MLGGALPSFELNSPTESASSSAKSAPDFRFRGTQATILIGVHRAAGNAFLSSSSGRNFQ